MRDFRPVSPLASTFFNRCPRCGAGRLFSGFLDVEEVCSVCGLKLGAHDSADAPAVFVILILGCVVVGLALFIDLAFAPPLWLHAFLWPPFILGAALAMLRPLKGLMIGLHYRYRPEDYDGPD